MTFQIKKGPSKNIVNATPIEGCWYITTDTYRIYACLDGKTIQPLEALTAETLAKIEEFEVELNQLKLTVEDLATRSYDSVVHVKERVNLPSMGKENIVYIVEDENAMYRWATIDDSTHWYCVGRDYMEIQKICGGDAIPFNYN